MKNVLSRWLLRVRGIRMGKYRDFLVFLFFLIVSACFWFLQSLDETLEVDIVAPLALHNVPENVRITAPLPSEVLVSVRDKGATLVRYYRKGKIDSVFVDFNQYDNGLISSGVQIPRADVQRIVQSKLESTTRILGMLPDTLDFYYNRGHGKLLPVAIRGTVTASSNSYLRGVTASPDSVVVYAPSAILDTLHAAYVQPVDMQDLTRTTSVRTGFARMRGVKYEPDQVTVQADVDYYTEKTVEVPIIGLNFPADRMLRTFPSRAKVTFRVEAARLRQVSDANFVLAPTYEELMRNESDKYLLHLRSVPEGVSNVRISPMSVDYLIEQIEDKEGSR